MSFRPQRDGPEIGGAQERAMSESVGGYDGIRTVEWQNGDGSWTRLCTRNGWPIFEGDTTSGAPTTASEQLPRGFVAAIPGGRAIQFNPYTLAILKTPYSPANNTWYVTDFATTWNVPTDDTTHWCDVVLFDGTKVKINAKVMPDLQITADHGFPAIPYLINRHDTSDQYGNAERNGYEKRVFAVGRYSVKSWGGGGIVETLTPTTPRTDGKAMTIGPRIDPATSKAWLGQLFFTTDSWDDMGSEWGFSGAEVAMLLTAPYLAKVSSGASVAITPPSLANDGATTGTASASIVLPATPWGLTANANVISVADYPLNAVRSIVFVWNGVFSDVMPGTLETAFTKVAYSGGSDVTSVQAGITLDCHYENTVSFDVRDEYTKVSASTLSYPSGPRWDATDDGLGGDADNLLWSSGFSPGGIPQYRGKTTRVVEEGIVSGSYIYGRVYIDQSGLFYSKCGLDYFVSISFARSKSYGPKAVLSPNLTFYDVFLGHATYTGPSGTGLLGQITLSGGNSRYHNSIPGGSDYTHQTAAVYAEINSAADDMAYSYASQTYFDDETGNGVGHIGGYYTATTNPSLVLDSQALSWSTKDYILYDTVNGVFISVEGSFVGANTSATLTVLLRVKTRAHTVVQTLGEFNYTYSELLPEVLIDTGRYAIPSPQIRAIFAPLYQEQGTFKGAHYVTLDEEANGATPFHGFNFRLNLRMYGDLATCNEDNDGHDVFFVPCNLLEMLYAFVFSQEYGVAESGERYPVTFTSRFTTMRDSLFTTPFRVSIRDGTVVNWTDSFGADFAAVSNVSLHRT